MDYKAYMNAGPKVRNLAPWIVLFGLCLLLQAGGLEPVLNFDRARIANGQWWLLLTGHLVHLNWSHFGLNMAGLAIVAVFFSDYLPLKQWLILLLWSLLFTGVCLYLFSTNLQRYVGLSGVLHGLFIVGAWMELKRYRLSGTVLLLGLVAKLSWEQLVGAMPGSEAMTGGHVAVAAHLYGAISGALFLLAKAGLAKLKY